MYNSVGKSSDRSGLIALLLKEHHFQHLLIGDLGSVPLERDHNGRLVAEGFMLVTSEEFVQEEMLKSGMAYVYPRFVDRCWNGTAMKAAGAIGQEQKAGVWAGSY